MLLTQPKDFPENLAIFSFEPSPVCGTMAGHPGLGVGTLAWAREAASHMGKTLGRGPPAGMHFELRIFPMS